MARGMYVSSPSSCSGWGHPGRRPVLTLYFQCSELHGVIWQVSAEGGFEGNAASFSYIAEARCGAERLLRNSLLRPSSSLVQLPSRRQKLPEYVRFPGPAKTSVHMSFVVPFGGRFSRALGGPNGSLLYDVRPHACASIFHSWPCFENVYARVPVRTTFWPLIVTVRVPAMTA